MPQLSAVEAWTHHTQELDAAFPVSKWEQLALVQTRFDETPAYAKLDRLPLAWWGLYRRR